ncbi:MAG: 50S ribosomal protein L25 [Candidatus Pacebacteria bacterium]|nr:50S ribosomal protein L25 [Candidatus Paceibacterota bacterium]PIR60901.1 MAG: 50S ribosomal protein L25 [Candidatus Pacebacteria bacterium CG10_big_fil_rev_8_21_14_0_10_44_54]
MTKNTAAYKFHVSSRDIKTDSIGNMAKNGDIPANIFGLSKPSISVKCAKQLVQKQQEDLESGLLYVVLDTKEEIPVLLEEIQKHPVTKEPQHVTFKRVNLSEKIEADVPLEIIGTCEVKNANVLLVRDELPIEALPSNIPENITIDISVLTEIGQTLGVADLQFDRASIALKLSEEELGAPLVIVQEQKEEVVEETVAQDEDVENHPETPDSKTEDATSQEAPTSQAKE